MPEISKMSPSLSSGPLKSTWGVLITHGITNLMGPIQSLPSSLASGKGPMRLMEGRNDIGPIGDELDMSCMLLGKAVPNVFITGTGCPGSISRPAEQCHTPALAMPVLHTSPVSPFDTKDSGNEYQPLTLSLADIAATMSMAASHIQASISQYQMEAANTEEPSATQIMHFKARLQWEITYSAARHIISVIPNLVAHIL
ncbi:uncharacterized protein BJ212DRAFT_1294642 [Suillus subaureus]|uniref:Uncharacterized protein n=1 Tax=Suillus subaureus TaxID=48587 RepID=A0A9P7EPX7_9AGAM|nr:uncharacterized protein BJ212DRAFT_1294642 [Suillus subaureus]KAG1827342.1 hypothetical protein BJ212DRAFT_1294642 [Suillus subaureus]